MYTPYQLMFAKNELEQQEYAMREAVIAVGNYGNLTEGEYMQIDYIQHNARRAVIKVMEIETAMQTAQQFRQNTFINDFI